MTANELLGWPPDARLLILNADDFGMYDAVNVASIDSIQNGVASSCTLMAPCPRAEQAMQLLRQHPDIPFGVHLTLICDFDEYVWGPLSPKVRVPSLLNDAGVFCGLNEVDRLRGQARLDEVELELRAQLESVLRAGLQPTHVDWHYILDGGREDIFELTVALAKEHGLAVRASHQPARQVVSNQGLPATDHDTVNSFVFDPEDKSARFAGMLRNLPVGLTEWAVHPALGDEESRALDPAGWQIRRSDYEFLVSNQAGDIIREEGIAVIDYRPLQEIWRRGDGLA